LLVDLKGVVKVLDMGLAKFTDNSKQASLTVAHDENVLGTADYLAPEQAENSHTVDSRADIYSLGCTLYFLLTGHPPFPEGTLVQRLMMHRSKVPPSIHIDRPDAPQSLVDIAMRMMAKLPADRFQTAADAGEALRSWLAANTSSGGSSKTGSRSSDSSGRMAVARGSREASAGGRGGAAPQGRVPGGGRSRERSPQIEDTVSDMDRGTIKGTGNPGSVRPKPGDSAKFRRALPMARPIEQNPFDFVTEEPVDRSRADSNDKPAPPAARQAAEAKRSAADRRASDSKVGGSKKGMKSAAADTQDSDAPQSAQDRIRARRNSAKSPPWLLAVFAVGFLVTVAVLGAAIYRVTHTKPPEPTVIEKASAKSKDGQKGKRGAKGAEKSKAQDSKETAAKNSDEKATEAADGAMAKDGARVNEGDKAKDGDKAKAPVPSKPGK
jgi:serine/threonine-protein kinase